MDCINCCCFVNCYFVERSGTNHELVRKTSLGVLFVHLSDDSSSNDIYTDVLQEYEKSKAKTIKIISFNEIYFLDKEGRMAGL